MLNKSTATEGNRDDHFIDQWGHNFFTNSVNVMQMNQSTSFQFINCSLVDGTEPSFVFSETDSMVAW